MDDDLLTDDNLRLIIKSCDDYMTLGVTPPPEFYLAVVAYEELLRRTAERFGKDATAEPMLEPAVLRFAASFLLAD